MSGLNKIMAEIMAKANNQSNEIINEANQKAAEITKKGQVEREEWKRQFEETVEQENREIISRAESTNRQSRRRALLSVRGEVIDEIIAEAKANIESLPTKEYFDFLFILFKKHAQPHDGVIHFAPADYAKIPDDFLERCNQVFPDYELGISGDREDIKRGFVIQYGNILQNCSMDAIFKSKRQTLRDKVYEVLTSDE